MQGWIKLHRKLLEWEWYDDHNTLILFIHLLLKANFVQRKWRSLTLKPGDYKTSLNSLVEETGLSKQSIRTSLDRLEQTHDITLKKTTKYTVISIQNWSEYQQTNTQDNTQLTHAQHTPNTPTRGTKNDKNEKNIYTSNENKIFSYFRTKSLNDLKETNQKIVDIAKEFDIRPKDVIYCVRDMLSKSSEKEIEIKSVKAKLNTWINNAIRWHNVATLSAKKEKNKPKPSQEDKEILKIKFYKGDKNDETYEDSRKRIGKEVVL